MHIKMSSVWCAAIFQSSAKTASHNSAPIHSIAYACSCQSSKFDCLCVTGAELFAAILPGTEKGSRKPRQNPAGRPAMCATQTKVYVLRGSKINSRAPLPALEVPEDHPRLEIDERRIELFFLVPIRRTTAVRRSILTCPPDSGTILTWPTDHRSPAEFSFVQDYWPDTKLPSHWRRRASTKLPADLTA